MKWIIKLVVVASAFALMSIGFDKDFSPSVAVSAQGEQGQAAGQAESLEAAGPEARAVFSGGVLEGVRKVTENAPSQTTSTVFVSLVGATTSWFVPAADSDLLNVSFSAECRLINSQLTPANQDWVELRMLLNRIPAAAGFPLSMQPNDTVSPMAFCSANGWAMHEANFAARVSGGLTGATYTVQVQRRVRNNAPVLNPIGVLTAWLDDWRLELAAHN